MRRYLRLIAVVLVLALLWAAFEWSGLRGHVTPAFLRERFERDLFWGMLAYSGLFALGNLVQIPGVIFLAAAVLALGRLWGGLATYVAACLSCCISFWVARWLGADALRELPGRFTRRVLARLDAHPVQSVAVLRLMFQTAPALNVALGLSGVGFRPYVAGTLIGLPLPILLLTLFFDSISHLVR
jgi:uncharacterized membrane protein YdjX (TVP38/TMEM64 family)